MERHRLDLSTRRREGFLQWLYDRQFEVMVERWRSENLGQEPDDKVLDILRGQAQMIVDDIRRSQYLEEMDFLYPGDDT